MRFKWQVLAFNKTTAALALQHHSSYLVSRLLLPSPGGMEEGDRDAMHRPFLLPSFAPLFPTWCQQEVTWLSHLIPFDLSFYPEVRVSGIRGGGRVRYVRKCYLVYFEWIQVHFPRTKGENYVLFLFHKHLPPNQSILKKNYLKLWQWSWNYIKKQNKLA